METKNKILELIEVQEKSVIALRDQKQIHIGRKAAFTDSLSAFNGDKSTSFDAAKRKIEVKISEETQSEREIDLKISDALARKSAFEEAIKLLPKTDADGGQKDLRPGSELAKVRDIIRNAACPVTLDQILVLLGKPGDKDKFRSLRGTIRAYAKAGRIFTIKCEDPHTFGLVELEEEKMKI